MPLGEVDFGTLLAGLPGLRTLPREKSVRAVYLRDRRALPDELKRLFDRTSVLRIPVEEPEDISRAIGVANGEIAGVNLGLQADTLHYVRTRLEMMKDRELSVEWGPKEDPFEGEILPQLDGFQLDVSGLRGVEIDGDNGVVRCEVGARWKEVFDACRTMGWIFPLFPLLPLDPYIGDIIGGTATLNSYQGDASMYVRNVDFLAPDARYGQGGFDLVPNGAAGYDLNSLMLVMGRHLFIPVSITFSLLCSVEDCKTLRYAPEDAGEMLEALRKATRTGVRPLKLVFGDDVGSRIAFGGDGLTVEAALHGTEVSLPVQEKTLDSLFKEGVKKDEIDGLVHPLGETSLRVPPSPIVEIRTSIVDTTPLMEDLVTWRDAQVESLGLVGSLFEDGTVSLIPFSDRPISRGVRFERLLELVQIARKHRCRLRSNSTLQLLSPETERDRRFELVRRIKERVDLPNVINPSGVLWLPRAP